MVKTSFNKRRAEAVFRRAVNSLPSTVALRDLPKTFRLLQPHLEQDSYPIVKMHFRFGTSYFGDGNFPGVVLATHLPIGKVSASSAQYPFLKSYAVVDKYEGVPLYPLIERGLLDKMKRRVWARGITSFAHVVLFFKGDKAVVFVPSMQKILGRTAWELACGRKGDKFFGSQGAGRHLLHLALAEKIVQEMKRRGVETELHVPTGENFDPAFQKDVNERINKPFRQLARHFERDEVIIRGRRINTLNLSRPK